MAPNPINSQGLDAWMSPSPINLYGLVTYMAPNPINSQGLKMMKGSVVPRGGYKKTPVEGRETKDELMAEAIDLRVNLGMAGRFDALYEKMKKTKGELERVCADLREKARLAERASAEEALNAVCVEIDGIEIRVKLAKKPCPEEKESEAQAKNLDRNADDGMENHFDDELDGKAIQTGAVHKQGKTEPTEAYLKKHGLDPSECAA